MRESKTFVLLYQQRTLVSVAAVSVAASEVVVAARKAIFCGAKAMADPAVRKKVAVASFMIVVVVVVVVNGRGVVK